MFKKKSQNTKVETEQLFLYDFNKILNDEGIAKLKKSINHLTETSISQRIVINSVNEKYSHEVLTSSVIEVINDLNKIEKVFNLNSLPILNSIEFVDLQYDGPIERECATVFISGLYSYDPIKGSTIKINPLCVKNSGFIHEYGHYVYDNLIEESRIKRLIWLLIQFFIKKSTNCKFVKNAKDISEEEKEYFFSEEEIFARFFETVVRWSNKEYLDFENFLLDKEINSISKLTNYLFKPLKKITIFA